MFSIYVCITSTQASVASRDVCGAVGAARGGPRRAEPRRSRPSGDARSTGRRRNTLFCEHVRARRMPARRDVVGVGDGGVVAMFRFVNKNLAVGSAEMAAVGRVGVGVGIGVVGQPVPLDVYRESHHLLALGGAIGMRGSIKHETWGRDGPHLRMRMDFLNVSTSCSRLPVADVSRHISSLRSFFRAKRAPEQYGVG